MIIATVTLGTASLGSFFVPLQWSEPITTSKAVLATSRTLKVRTTWWVSVVTWMRVKRKGDSALWGGRQYVAVDLLDENEMLLNLVALL